MAFRSLLGEVLEGWWDGKNGLIDEVRVIPANRFEFRPTPEVKDVRELGTLLRSQMRDADKRFRAVGELSLLQFIERFGGEKGTKLAWLHHGIEQEMYHRGQLTLYIRKLGMEPALTKRIRGG